MSDFKKLKVVELRAECAARNLPQTGKRDELIERLEEYEFHNAEPMEVETETDQLPESINQSVLESNDSKLVSDQSKPIIISPVQAPVKDIDDLAAQEEQKRRLRALRFGLDSSQTAPVNIEITIKRLEHALPYRHHRHHRNHKRHREISINKH